MDLAQQIQGLQGDIDFLKHQLYAVQAPSHNAHPSWHEIDKAAGAVVEHREKVESVSKRVERLEREVFKVLPDVIAEISTEMYKRAVNSAMESLNKHTEQGEQILLEVETEFNTKLARTAAAAADSAVAAKAISASTATAAFETLLSGAHHFAHSGE